MQKGFLERSRAKKRRRGRRLSGLRRENELRITSYALII
jgi:hypothetical protein